MIILPKTIRITDGAFAMDGGSTFLTGFDTDNNPITIQFEWPLDSQVNNHSRLIFNGEIIPKRSNYEASLITIIENAEIYSSKTKASQDITPNIIIGDDIKNVFNAIADNPNTALKVIISEMLKKIRSKNY